VLREEVLKADVDREAARANVRVAVEAILKLSVLLFNRIRSAKKCQLDTASFVSKGEVWVVFERKWEESDSKCKEI